MQFVFVSLVRDLEFFEKLAVDSQSYPLFEFAFDCALLKLESILSRSVVEEKVICIVEFNNLAVEFPQLWQIGKIPIFRAVEKEDGNWEV